MRKLNGYKIQRTDRGYIVFHRGTAVLSTPNINLVCAFCAVKPVTTEGAGNVKTQSKAA